MSLSVCPPNEWSGRHSLERAAGHRPGCSPTLQHRSRRTSLWGLGGCHLLLPASPFPLRGTLRICHPEVPPLQPVPGERLQADFYLTKPAGPSCPDGSGSATRRARLRSGQVPRTEPSPGQDPSSSSPRHPESPPQGTAARGAPRRAAAGRREQRHPPTHPPTHPAARSGGFTAGHGAFPPHLAWGGGGADGALRLWRGEAGGEWSAVPCCRRRKSLRGPAPRAAAFMGCGPGPAVNQRRRGAPPPPSGLAPPPPRSAAVT